MYAKPLHKTKKSRRRVSNVPATWLASGKVIAESGQEGCVCSQGGDMKARRHRPSARANSVGRIAFGGDLLGRQIVPTAIFLLGSVLAPWASSHAQTFARDASPILQGVRVLQTGSLRAGDLDNDGDNDLVAGTAAVNYYLLNDGCGSFGAAIDISTESEATNEITLSDVDNDGRLDVIAANGTSTVWQTNRVYLNNGLQGGVVQWTVQDIPKALIDFDNGGPNPPVQTETRSTYVVAGEIDGQNGPDVVFGNCCGPFGFPNQLYLNDGAGYLGNDPVQSPAPNLTSDDTAGLAIGDIDNDGDLDVVENGTSILNICRNESGTLFCGGTMGLVPSLVLALGDLNGDTYLDVIAGGYTSTDTHIYFNDGSGNFTAGVPVGGIPEQTVLELGIGDVDGDGDQDIIEGNGNFDRPNQLLLNRGDGTFVSPVPISTDVAATTAMVLAEMTGDRDLDLVVKHGADLWLFRNVSIGSGLPTFLTQLDVPGSAALGTLLWDRDRGRHFAYRLDVPGSVAGPEIGFGIDEVLATGTVPDVSGDNAEELAALITDAGAVEVRLKTLSNGALVSRLFFDRAYAPHSLIVLPNAAGGLVLPAVGVLGTDASGRVRVQLKNAVTGELVSLAWFDRRYTPFAARVIPDVNGNQVEEIAVLGTDAEGRVRVQVKDGLSGDRVGTVVYFDRTYEPLLFVVTPDLDGNGVPDLGVLGQNSAGTIRLQVKDILTGARTALVRYQSGSVPAFAVATVINNDPVVGVLGRHPEDGLRLQVKSLSTGQPVSSVAFDQSLSTAGLEVLPDVGGDAVPEAAMVGRDGSCKAVAQVKDMLSGQLVQRSEVP